MIRDNRSSLTLSRVVVIWLVAWLSAEAVMACGPYPIVARFWYSHQPSDVAVMIGGEPGVVDPEYRPEFLWLAYRHLAGLGIDDPEAVAAAFAPELNPRDRWTELWHQADSPWTELRTSLAPSIPWDPRTRIDMERMRVTETADGKSYEFYVNCLPDGFVTAARTLAQRIDTYGASSREVAEWALGQDVVFQNCDGGTFTPDLLDASWPAALRADRAYQIAAAHFYSERWDEAAELFRAIDADPASPWQPVALYLVARSQLRAGHLETALATFQGVLERPAAERLHASARGLVQLILYRRDPFALRRELASRLGDADLASAVGDDELRESLIAWGRTFRADDGSPLADLTAWARAMAPEPWRADEDRARLFALHADSLGADPSPTWLVARLATARVDPERPQLTSELTSLLDAAAGVSAESPAWLPATYHRARLLLDVGAFDQARQGLDAASPIVDAGRGSVADRNRVHTLRLRAATAADDVLRFAQQEPLEVGAEIDTIGPLHVWQGLEEQIDAFGAARLFANDALGAINLLTPGEIFGAIERGIVDEHLVPQLALMAWTRALLLEDWSAAHAADTVMRSTHPVLAKDLDALRQATPEDRPFVAAAALLRLPASRPDLHPMFEQRDAITELDFLGTDWWCGGEAFDLAEVSSVALFHDDPQRHHLAERLRTLPPATLGLGNTVLGWADAHPNDPRVPEALHRVVYATRHACRWGEDVKPVSKGAFDRLHRRYSDSPWTEKTPYWFD